jgi:sterol desaturase/sphingolipid hydroxylase (fatty acid hydroxylase superfamily)
MTLAILGAAALLLAGLERSAYLRFRPSAFFRRHFTGDVIYLLTGFVAGGSAATAYIVAASGWLEQSLSLPRLASAGLPVWLLVLPALVAIDLGNYLAHYWLHRSDLLWEFHKIHHSSTMLDWLATFRSHIAEQILRRLVAPVLLILIGFPLGSVLIASAIFISWAMFNHSNLKINLRLLEPVLITPRLHRVHHLYRTSEKNLGTIFTFWDRMRGTLVFVETDEKSVFSNGEAAYPQSWPAQLIEPVLRITRIRRASYQ